MSVAARLRKLEEQRHIIAIVEGPDLPSFKHERDPLLPLLADVVEAAEKLRRRGHAETCRWVRGGPDAQIEWCDCGAHAWDTVLARLSEQLDQEEGAWLASGKPPAQEPHL